MGGSIERWLKESQQPPVPAVDKPGPVTDWLQQANPANKLRTAVQMSDPTKADSAARVRFLQDKTGLSADLISRNPDEVARRAVTSDFDPDKFSAAYPETAKWLSEQPEHASVGLDDLSNLGHIERSLRALKRGWQIGHEEAQIGDLQYKDMESRSLSDVDKKRLRALEADVKREPGGIGFWDELVYKTAKMFGQMSNATPEVGTGAAVGAAAAMVGTGIAAAAGVTLAAPVLATAVAAGAAVGLATSTLKTLTGQTYTQLKQIKGQNGEEIEDGTARLVALGVGAASASLMVGGAEVAAAPFRAAGSRLFASAAKDALLRPTMRMALQDMGVSYAKAMAGGTSIMALQEMANIIGEEIAKIGTSGNFETVLNSAASREQAIKRIGTAIKEGAEAMALAAAPGALFHGLSTGYQARIADRNAGYFKALGEGVEGSETFRRLPSGIQRLVEQQTRDGPLENVYVPAEFWNSYWQKKGADPSDMAERVLGDKTQWQDATSHGGDIQIPTSKYATTIAPSEHNAAFSKELRRSPLEMSSEEAKDAVKNEEKATAPTKEQTEARQAHEESADRVAAEVHHQLLAAEIDPRQAADYTAIYRAVFSTMGERTKQLREGFTRLYRSVKASESDADLTLGATDESELGRWFAEDKELAKVYADGEDTRHYYVDVPTDVVEKNQDAEYAKSIGAPITMDGAVLLPAEYAKKARRVKDFNSIGQTPEELFKKYGLTIAKGEFKEGEGLEQKIGWGAHKGKLLSEIDEMEAFDEETHEEAIKNSEPSDFKELRDLAAKRREETAALRQAVQLGDREAFRKIVERNSVVDQYGMSDAMGETIEENHPILHAWMNNIPAEFFQSREPSLPPGFYSAAERAIEEKMPNRASMEDVRNILKNVKAEERKWLGLDTGMLHAGRDTKEMLSKEAVLDVLRANRLNIEESNAVYDGVDEHNVLRRSRELAYNYASDLAYQTEIEMVDGSATVVEWPDDITTGVVEWLDSSMQRHTRPFVETRHLREWLTEQAHTYLLQNHGVMEDFAEEARAEIEEDGESASQYEQYTLPGGENYRELLFKLPTLDGKYESNHFPDAGPVFAHARLKDRVDAEGSSVLFIEEIQSDWHQSGREHGYRNDAPAFPSPEVAERFLELERMPYAERVQAGLQGEFIGLMPYDQRQKFGVPDAPFRSTWHEFVFKRLLREATEKGYDRVAWTTGEQQNERYGLEKHVDRITYHEQTGILQGYRLYRGPDGQTSVAEMHEGNKVFHEVVPREKLADYIGKEVAVKLMTKEPEPMGGHSTESHRVLEGKDLRVGGSGMRGFYDDILPRFANKFGKKFGAKVEPLQLTEDALSEGFSAYGMSEEEKAAKLKELETPPTVHSMALTPELKRAALANEFALFQRSGNEPLGRIRIGDSVSIDMFAKADFSTFVHESGHFFMQVLSDATDETSRADLTTVRSWLGVEGDGPLTRDQHEMFARGFEKYLAEGRAPVSALQSVFLRFKTWMMAVYAHLRDLHVDLTDDVRGVFDHMMSSEADIKAEQTRQPQLFETIKSLKLPEAEAKAYTDAVERAHTAASEEMAKKIMADHARESTAVFQAEREQVRGRVAEELAGDRTYRARALLEDGTMPGGGPLPDGETPFKLDSDSTKAMGHTLPDLTSSDPDVSLHPDMAADLLGFGSGEEMLRSLAEGQHPDKEIDRRTNAVMRGKKTQIQLLTATEVPTEAMKAVHTEKRAELLRKELQILAAQELPKVKGLVQRLSRRIPKIDDIRGQAKSIVDAKVVGTLTAQTYLRAEQRAANAAIEAFNKGDIQEAFDQKQRELLNHELFRAAADAQEFVEKASKYMRRFDDKSVRQRLGKAGGPYLDQIDAIRERFDFTQISARDVRRRESLRAFVESKQAEGITPDIPDYVMDEAFHKNFRELTIDQLRGVYQSARQIEHLSRTKNKLLAAERGRTFSATKTSIVERIADNFDIKIQPPDYAPGLMKRTGRALSRADAELTRMEFLFKYLDGHQANGPVWNALLKPIQEAENVESARFRQAQRTMTDIFGKAYSKSERAMFWWKKYDVKELNTSLTKPSLLAIALNHGNEYNREALYAGHEKFGWTEAGVQAALSHLDKRDWDTVQRIWDHLDSYWPEIARLEKRMTGLEPERVQATPVMTPFGEYKGGYYPIMFDKEVSWKQASVEAESNTKDLFGGSWVYATTKHGHVKERVGTGGKPLLLTLSPLTNHLANVIHDLSYRPAIIDVNRIVSSPEVRNAIEGSVGRDMYAQLHPWLVSIARERRGDYANAMESLVARGRQGATVVHIGWRMTTALVHIPNYTVTVKELGPKYAAKGIADVYANPVKIRQQYRFVTSTSPFMKERFETFDRDIRDQMSRMNISDVAAGPMSVLNPYLHPAAMRASFFHLIHAAITGGSLPTWMGGYRKAMDGHVEGVNGGDLEASRDYADSLVREVWSAGAIKDLASVQRGSESWRMFTMFYTFMGTVYNQMKKTGQEYKLYGNFPKLVAGAAAVWFIPAAMSQLLIGRGPDDVQDPEEWAKWMARTEMEWPMSTIPIVRDIARPIIGGKGDYAPSAAFDMGKTFVKTAQSMEKKVAEDTEFSRKDWENAFDTAGYFLKLPTKQLWLTLESMFDYMTGEKQVTSAPTDIYHMLVSQAPKDPQAKPQQVASTAPLLGELRQQFLR